MWQWSIAEVWRKLPHFHCHGLMTMDLDRLGPSISAGAVLGSTWIAPDISCVQMAFWKYSYQLWQWFYWSLVDFWDGEIINTINSECPLALDRNNRLPCFSNDLVSMTGTSWRIWLNSLAPVWRPSQQQWWQERKCSSLSCSMEFCAQSYFFLHDERLIIAFWHNRRKLWSSSFVSEAIITS